MSGQVSRGSAGEYQADDRAGSLAGTALDAEIRIDDMLSITLGDSSDRATGCTCTAVYTIITDDIRHIIILLIIDWLKL